MLRRGQGTQALPNVASAQLYHAPMPAPAVFFDRDGVLNEVRMDGATAAGPRSVEELAIVPGAAGELARLREAGFRLLVVSNQPDVARGTLSRAAVDAVNAALRAELAVDAIYYCPHDTADGCTCRKPLPGLILQGAAEWDVDLARSCLVGDRWVDLMAAQRAGIEGILLERPWSWQHTSAGGPPGDLRTSKAFGTLAACVDWILQAAPNSRRP